MTQCSTATHILPIFLPHMVNICMPFLVHFPCIHQTSPAFQPLIQPIMGIYHITRLLPLNRLLSAPHLYYCNRIDNPPGPAPAAAPRARDRREFFLFDSLFSSCLFIWQLRQGYLSHVDVSIPRNSEVENGIVTRVTNRLPPNLYFNDFFEGICASMDIQPADAVLGYKFSGDRVSDPANRLANADDFGRATSRAIDKIKRARTREVVFEINNLVSDFRRLFIFSIV